MSKISADGSRVSAISRVVLYSRNPLASCGEPIVSFIVVLYYDSSRGGKAVGGAVLVDEIHAKRGWQQFLWEEWVYFFGQGLMNRREQLSTTVFVKDDLKSKT